MALVMLAEMLHAPLGKALPKQHGQHQKLAVAATGLPAATANSPSPIEAVPAEPAAGGAAWSTTSSIGAAPTAAPASV
eukprot:CAMPEP_0176134882 /NCGR_PEP_ID=MMETSP0120_2-20121206/68405_1 /TAXON_ID=160619 /ORGANISM="Kryptoperidinium foliaceum, Strain CCMP 1326" /LENGTH=77 /DNA_ID=CAMNT_0017470543 /DNA_START=58 /DNA_END=288 /DNA_ORIENTATION=+